MILAEILLQSFRNYDTLRVAAGEGFNFIVGDNAQGKSNFLEAIYCLSLGRSYRTNREDDVVRFSDPFARVEGNFVDSSGGDFSLDLTWERAVGKDIRKTVKYNANVLSKLAELIDKAPMVMMTADDLDLIRGVPDQRRKFLDLLCSRLYPPYVVTLREYKQVLDARNHWLKLPAGSRDAYLGEVYREKLVRAGSDIIFRRLHTLDSLKSFIGSLYREVFKRAMPELRYRSTVKDIRETTSVDIARAYRESLDRVSGMETTLGFTMTGPHRDDFDLKDEGRSMRQFSSMGEIRTVAVVLKLAETEAIAMRTGRTPVICADDCFNEFDPERARVFIDFLSAGRQVFYATTAISPVFESIPNLSTFRVVEGTVTPCSLYHLKAS